MFYNLTVSFFDKTAGIAVNADSSLSPFAVGHSVFTSDFSACGVVGKVSLAEYIRMSKTVGMESELIT